LNIQFGGARIYVLKKRYAQSNQRYICGKHVTKESLSSPTKANINDKVTGQYIYNLALTVIRNLKKVSAIGKTSEVSLKETKRTRKKTKTKKLFFV
jgi:hypothetical protein